MKKLLLTTVFLSCVTMAYYFGGHQNPADKYWQNAQEVDKDTPTNYLYRALTLKSLFEFECALEHINKVLETVPDNITALKIKGSILQVIGHFQQAYSIYSTLLSLTHNKKDYNYELYSCLTALGKLSEATKVLQEWRILTGRSVQSLPINVGDIQNKSVLIVGERAFGDQIQHIRLAALFKKYGAKKIIYATFEKLIPLFSTCPYVDEVVDVKKAYPLTDLRFTMDELLYLLQIDIDAIPNELPYLFARKELISHHKQYFKSNSHLKIGICWQAKQGLFHELTAYCNRNMPLSYFKDISSIANIELYALQKGPGTEQLKDNPFTVYPLPIDFDEYNGAFIDTAAFMKHLDLIITVDTSIAHLAGALGLRVWVLLPHTADVRWMVNRSDTPWYPTMKLFRQKSPGNWKQVIEEIKTILENKNYGF